MRLRIAQPISVQKHYNSRVRPCNHGGLAANASASRAADDARFRHTHMLSDACY